MKKQALVILLIAMSFEFAIAKSSTGTLRSITTQSTSRVNLRDPALDIYASNISAAENCPLKSAKSRTANTSGATKNVASKQAGSNGARANN